MATRGLGPRPSSTSIAALTAAAVGAGCLGLAVAAPTAAVAAPCATAYAVDDLAPGQEVNGLTVDSGTVPAPFTGEIKGVLADGIAPGVPMILAELSSPAVDRNGIWSGMSGSPVYADAAQTQLVGAVSYTLNEGKETLAGITPAADMLAIAADDVDQQVDLTPQLVRRLAADGTATRSELGAGMRPLPTPIAVSGLTSRRFGQLAGWLDDLGPVTRASSGSGTAAAAGVEDLVPGGNVAASLGYGFVSASGTGTVTDVCGDKVLAFGHPFNYAGPSTYSLHPAEAVAIVPGSTFAGFKLANLGAPVGTFDEDRMAGIRGTVGTLPEGYDVSSTATYKAKSVSGTTTVTVQDLVADAALANAFAASDKAIDRVGKGSADASWTITGKRRDGSPFSLTHSDVYASADDIASAPVSDLAMQAYALLSNETEAVTITGVSTTTALRDDATRWSMGRAFWRPTTTAPWRRVSGSSPAVVRPGAATQVRVELISRDAATRYVTVPVRPTDLAVGRSGRLVLEGGYTEDDEFYFFDSSEEFFDEYEDEILGGSLPETIPQLLARLRKDPRNDSVTSTLTVPGTTKATRTVSLGQVVSGGVLVPVVVRR